LPFIVPIKRYTLQTGTLYPLDDCFNDGKQKSNKK